MPSLEEVYQRFGFASEAAQLLETELGNALLASGAVEANLLENPEREKAADQLSSINRQTLGQLIKRLNHTTKALPELEDVLIKALNERNRLSHSFYREHNFRRNTEEGRAVMLKDLESIHNTILEAYKVVLRLSGIDLDEASIKECPKDHVPI